jgi:hypothetical protein
MSYDNVEKDHDLSSFKGNKVAVDLLGINTHDAFEYVLDDFRRMCMYTYNCTGIKSNSLSSTLEVPY